MGTRPVRWLHLSDFHVGRPDYERHRLFEKIIMEVQDRVNQGQAPDMVFITGDVVFSGQRAQYELFLREFYEPFREAVGSPCDQRIFIVPGNHDVDLTKARAVDPYGVLARVPEFLEPSDQGLDERGELLKRFRAFSDLVPTLRPNLNWLSGPDGALVHIVHIHDVGTVGVLGLNTAWLSMGSDYDVKKLTPGKRMVEKGLKRIKGESPEAIIVLGHHPIDWFRYEQEESKVIRSLFSDYQVIYLHGHLHSGDAIRIGDGENDFMVLQAGASYEVSTGDSHVTRVLWCELNISERKVLTVEPRKWSDTNKWVPDFEACRMTGPEASMGRCTVLLGRASGYLAVKADQGQISNYPQAKRTKLFTGRHKLLEDLRSSLKVKKTDTAVSVLWGLGGVGKTQTALEYAHIYSPDYKVLWWFDAENINALGPQFLHLGTELGVPGLHPRLPTTDIINRVLDQLRGIGSWLLIFDNAEDASELRRFIPDCRAGHVIVTSRNDNWNVLGPTLLPVDLWNPEEAATFLLKRSKGVDVADARMLAEELRYLPLALEQAGAFIESELSGSIEAYYEAYKTQRLQLLQDPHGLKHQSMYSESVATTFSITFRRIHENEYGPQAMNLLHLMAFLAADDIPQQMLTDYAQYHPGLLSNDSQTLSDYLALIRSKSLLSRYSLVKLDEVNGTVSLHRLVQQVVQDMMPGEEKASWARTAVGIINSQMPGQAGDALNWIPATGRLLAHGVEAERHAQECGLFTLERARLLNKMGVYWSWVGPNELGLEALEKAFDVDSKLCSQTDLILAEDLYELGRARRFTEDRLGARNAHQQALSIRKTVLGPKHPSLEKDLYGLGLVLVDLGELTPALEQFEHAINILRHAPREKLPDLAKNLNAQGLTLLELGKLNEARKICDEALKIDEACFPPGAQVLARDMGVLARVLLALGEFHKAQERLQRALDINEKVFGKQHANYAKDLKTLALVFKELGKFHEALGNMERAYAIDKNTYRETVRKERGIDLNYLGMILREQGRPDEAMKHFEQALSTNMKIYGEVHPQIARDRSGLGLTLTDLGVFDKANEELRKARNIDFKFYGADHYLIAVDNNALGQLEFAKGNFDNSLSFFSKAIELTRRTLGHQHHYVVRDLNCIGKVFQAKGDNKEARRHWDEALSICEKRLPDYTYYLQKTPKRCQPRDTR